MSYLKQVERLFGDLVALPDIKGGFYLSLFLPGYDNDNPLDIMFDPDIAATIKKAWEDFNNLAEESYLEQIRRNTEAQKRS